MRRLLSSNSTSVLHGIKSLLGLAHRDIGLVLYLKGFWFSQQQEFLSPSPGVSLFCPGWRPARIIDLKACMPFNFSWVPTASFIFSPPQMEKKYKGESVSKGESPFVCFILSEVSLPCAPGTFFLSPPSAWHSKYLLNEQRTPQAGGAGSCPACIMKELAFNDRQGWPEVDLVSPLQSLQGILYISVLDPHTTLWVSYTIN